MSKPIVNSTIPEDLLNSKEYKALEKQMGEANCREFFAKEGTDLRAIIAECQVQEKEARMQTDENEDYARAKGILKDFNSALREAVKPLRLKKHAAAAIVNFRKATKPA